jgi:hypothetical protein
METCRALVSRPHLPRFKPDSVARSSLKASLVSSRSAPMLKAEGAKRQSIAKNIWFLTCAADGDMTPVTPYSTGPGPDQYRVIY